LPEPARKAIEQLGGDPNRVGQGGAVRGDDVLDRGLAADAAGRAHDRAALELAGPAQGLLREGGDQDIGLQLRVDPWIGGAVQSEEVAASLQHPLGEEKTGDQVLVAPRGPHRRDEGGRGGPLLPPPDADLERLLDGEDVFALEFPVFFGGADADPVNRFHGLDPTLPGIAGSPGGASAWPRRPRAERGRASRPRHGPRGGRRTGPAAAPRAPRESPRARSSRRKRVRPSQGGTPDPSPS